MSDYAEIVALAEGLTEKIFIQDIISPHLAGKGIYITPIIISKPGQKGGDVRFARVRNDIGLHLKQRHDTYLTLFADYYGLRKNWPGLTEARKQTTPEGKAEKVNSATKEVVNRLFGDHGSDRRFIPYIAMNSRPCSSVTRRYSRLIFRQISRKLTRFFPFAASPKILTIHHKEHRPKGWNVFQNDSEKPPRAFLLPKKPAC